MTSWPRTGRRLEGGGRRQRWRRYGARVPPRERDVYDKTDWAQTAKLQATAFPNALLGVPVGQERGSCKHFRDEDVMTAPRRPPGRHAKMKRKSRDGALALLARTMGAQGVRIKSRTRTTAGHANHVRGGNGFVLGSRLSVPLPYNSR